MTQPDAQVSEGGARPRHPLTVLTLAGSQEDMGRQHGELVAARGGFEPVLDYYAQMPGRTIGTAELPAPARGLAHLAFDRLLRRLDARRPAELRARARAFFSAVGRPPAESRHMFCMDLLQNVVGVAGRWGALPAKRVAQACAVPSCTSLVVWGRASAGGTLRHARNFDFPGVGVWEKGPTVVLCRPDQGLRYGFVTTWGADVAAVSVWNEAGLVVTPHTRFHRDVRFDGAGIVDLVHAIARRAGSIEAAWKVAREHTPIASTWGIAVSSAREGRAVVLETTSAGVELVTPGPDEDYLANANRYRSALRAGEVVPSAGFIPNSDGRWLVARRRAARAQGKGGLDHAALFELLGSHEDPEDPSRERALGGVVAQTIAVHSVVVEPEAERTWLSVGPVPTGHGPWVEVPWAWSDAPSLREVAPPAGHEAPHRFARGPHAAGYRAFIEAVTRKEAGEPFARVAEAYEQAAALDPEEPSYRLLAGAARLKQGDVRGGRAHFETGAMHERSPFHRGQLLFWAARAAAAMDEPGKADHLRDALLEVAHPALVELKETSERERGRCYPPRRFRKLVLNPSFPDVT